MKLLLDESLSSRLSDPLSEVGHDVIHVGDLDLLSEPDDVILAAARRRDRVLVSADTDFGTLLAISGAAKTQRPPSTRARPHTSRSSRPHRRSHRAYRG